MEILVADGRIFRQNRRDRRRIRRKISYYCRKAIHQENGGHGEAVNEEYAMPQVFILRWWDSDDWVNAEAYAQILKTLGSKAYQRFRNRGSSD